VTHGSRGPLNIFETQISCVLLILKVVGVLTRSCCP
jgi:hypothetical protein